MEIIYSASMGTASMVLATLLVYLCFAFIFVGDFQLVSATRNNLRTHIDSFGYSIRELEIFSFTTFLNAIVCLILQPVIYVIMFTSYGLDIIAYAKFMIALLAILVLERMFFLDMVLKRRGTLKVETLLLHTIGLGVLITLLLGSYFRAVGAT